MNERYSLYNRTEEIAVDEEEIMVIIEEPDNKMIEINSKQNEIKKMTSLGIVNIKRIVDMAIDGINSTNSERNATSVSSVMIKILNVVRFFFIKIFFKKSIFFSKKI